MTDFDEAPSLTIHCPGCGCAETIGEHHHFRMHDRDCPEMPADMANIPNEIRQSKENDR